MEMITSGGGCGKLESIWSIQKGQTINRNTCVCQMCPLSYKLESYVKEVEGAVRVHLGCVQISTLSFGQSFPASAPLTFSSWLFYTLEGSLMHCQMFCSLLGLYPLESRNTPCFPSLATPNISSHCPMFLGREKLLPTWEPLSFVIMKVFQVAGLYDEI